MLVLAILLIAISNELTIAHPGDPFDTAGLVTLGAGPALYLLGHEVFRYLMAGQIRILRLTGIPLLVAAAAIGAATDLSALAIQGLALASSRCSPSRRPS